MTGSTLRQTRTSGWIVVTSLVCAAAIGVVVVVETMLDARDAPLPSTLWWAAYALYIAALLAIHGWIPTGRLSPHALLVSLIGFAVLLVLLNPDQAWMLMLFVMTAAVASFFWPPRAIVVLLIVQILLTVGIALTAAWPLPELVLAVVGFGNFQVFGALVVFAMRSEARARDDLAVAHAELRATTTLLEMTTREAERLRISRDLHDLAGHDLTALSLELEVATHLTADTAGHRHVQRARSIARDLLETIRTAVGEMRDEAPMLEPALRRLTSGIPGLSVTVHVDRDISVDADRVIVILRSVQEAMTNILRHSGADHASVDVRAEQGDLRVTIADQGEGTAAIVPGNGLTGMRERFEVLGGSLEVTSAAGRGLVLVGRLPRHAPATP
ncbi:sensor histidine kinase [Microbacterium sp. 179-I 3D3 NHS]|uniref:sensor histidine kinase n=1 Tax=unclassified Microbacterium TaxID=2609290 RepID=UPI0039A1A91B